MVESLDNTLLEFRMEWLKNDHADAGMIIFISAPTG